MVHQFKELINRYTQIVNKNNPHIDVDELENTQHLLSKFQPFIEKINIQEKLETPHYNIFRILNIKHLESVTHTPFISNLLNPDGSHSQQSLFLDKFFEEIFIANDKPFSEYSIKYLRVYEEFRFLNGRIDILILHKHPELSRKFAIIIENKINSGDQNDQLKRYYDFAINTLKLSPRQILIIYLTLDGTEPSEFSLDNDLKSKLLLLKVLKNISYGKEIRSWLKKSYVESDKIKQIVIQYLEILNELSYEQDESRAI